MSQYSVIGKRLPRVDARVKVTGQAKYAADLELPDALWGKLLRSPYPHARILNVDTTRAERLPGVKAVVTAKDFGNFRWGFLPTARDEAPLAVDRVRYLAEAVAAVAATDEDLAEEATHLIKVDYEELPAIFDPFEAMKEGAPQIHDYVRNNIGVEHHWNFGDVEEGFAESYIVREDRFKTGRVTHGYVEPPAVLAYYDPGGHITVWASKQSPYFVYRHLAGCFDLPLNKVRIIQPFIGGGFGGTKNDSLSCDFCAVLLSKKTGRPVKFVYSQEEELTTSRRRHPVTIDIKTGVKRDGTRLAVQTGVVADGGAYMASGPLTMYLTGVMMTLPYKLPNFKHDVYRVFTNAPISAAMRGHGVSHTRFAAEVQLDMIAEELGIDPVEIRLRNAIEAPHETANKIIVKSCGLREAIKKVADTKLWVEKGSRKKREGNISRGVGFSAASYLSGARLMGHRACAAILRVCEDGTVNLLTGATDPGTGSDTALCQIAAEELGITLEDIEIRRVDTAVTPVDPGTYGSRVTVLAGDATRKAAADAKRQLLAFAAKAWQVNPEDIEIRDKRAFVKTEPQKNMSFSRLVRAVCYSGSGEVIIGKGYSSFSDKSPLNFDTGEGNPGTSYSFIAQAAEVEVDTETGQTRCTNTLMADDCGTRINPIGAEGQVEGGAIMGLGQVLYEDFKMDKGRTLNPTFVDYKMPLSTDVPDIKLIEVTTSDPDSPFGAKEASESSITSTPPAVVSAIHDATGVWFKELPVTPEIIFKALRTK